MNGRDLRDVLDGELLRRRSLQLIGELDYESASLTAAALMTLDAEGDDPIELRITSGKGSLDAAVSLIDTIDLLGVPLRAVALGRVGGPAGLVLAFSPERFAAPSARIGLQVPGFRHAGRPDELLSSAQDSVAQIDRLVERLTASTRLTGREAARALESPGSFSAEEALAVGLVDAIAVPNGSPGTAR